VGEEEEEDEDEDEDEAEEETDERRSNKKGKEKTSKAAKTKANNGNVEQKKGKETKQNQQRTKKTAPEEDLLVLIDEHLVSEKGGAEYTSVCQRPDKDKPYSSHHASLARCVLRVTLLCRACRATHE
jgi:hypothetical protein